VLTDTMLAEIVEALEFNGLRRLMVLAKAVQVPRLLMSRTTASEGL